MSSIESNEAARCGNPGCACSLAINCASLAAAGTLATPKAGAEIASVEVIPSVSLCHRRFTEATRVSRLSGPGRPLAATSDVRRPLTTPAACTAPSGASAFVSVASSSPELTATKKMASGSRPSARAAARCSLALPECPARSASTASTRRAPRGRAASSCRAAIVAAAAIRSTRKRATTRCSGRSGPKINDSPDGKFSLDSELVRGRGSIVRSDKILA